MGEVYRVTEEVKRRTSLKDNWFFAPMEVRVETIKPNPNTLRKVGEIRILEQDDHFLNLSLVNLAYDPYVVT